MAAGFFGLVAVMQQTAVACNTHVRSPFQTAFISACAKGLRPTSLLQCCAIMLVRRASNLQQALEFSAVMQQTEVLHVISCKPPSVLVRSATNGSRLLDFWRCCNQLL